MNKLIIRPLLNFIHKQTRDYMTAGDLAQLENKITNTLKSKRKQGHATWAEEEYLKITNELKGLFATTPRIKNSEIISQVTKLLRAANYDYEKQEHRSRHRKNSFFGEPAAPPNLHTYDIAFYNEQGGETHRAHHQHKNQRSVYYMRCQEFADTIIFGNMQIDAENPEDWKNPVLGRIMLQKKNIYRMMVHQALKHALSRGKKEILFQAGDANEIAQWGRTSLKRVKVTKRNIARFHENYHQQMKNFGPAGLKPGDVITIGQNKNFYAAVLTADNNSYKALFGYRWHDDLFDTLIGSKVGWERPGFKIDQQTVKKIIKEQMQKFNAAQYFDRDNNKLLGVINKTVTALTGRRPRSGTPQQMVEKIKSIYQKNNIDDLSLVKMLEKLNYDQFFLRAYPNLKKLDLTAHQIAGINTSLYYDSENSAVQHTFIKDQYQTPQLGLEYLTPIFDRYNINFRQLPAAVGFSKAGIYNWYENTLTQEFKKQNLKYARVEIKTVKKGREKTAHAWKITAGLKNFKSTPLTVFSTRSELKMDCETLPRLQAAAAKFGVVPRQLKLVNNFLLGPEGRRHTGAYNQRTGEIILANRSLAVLAHEGLHKLKAQKVIPVKEYRALVAAGKRIAATKGAEYDYINQRDTDNNWVYPPGKTRDEEYAAVFVETHYENSPLARKNLMGVKLTMTEKLLNYVKDVVDLIQVKRKIPAACARQFLRQVERNHFKNFIPAQTKAPSRARNFRFARA